MTCPACGRDNLPGAVRCGGCARLLPESGHPSSAGPAPADHGAATGVLGGAVPPPGTTGGFAPGSRLAPGTPLGTRYVIEATLGEGGMGMVYRAHDRELNRTVALKVIRPELASHPEILERFKREILLASKVTHKNVVRLHDLGEVGDLRFISMTYIEGESLKALLEHEGPLSAERGVPLLRGIAEALQAAHEAGVVHRDLKPHNVLVDREGQPYVGDFGISRSMTSEGTMTETGAILGTVDYMSPEQARGEVPDHRSDIYALGVMMFEMFTGTLPFRAANPLSVMVKRVHEDAPSPTQVRPGIPAWLSAIMLRALIRDPKARYQSAADLVRDLDRQRATRARRRLFGKRAALLLVGTLTVGAAAAGTVRYLRSRVAAPPAVKSALALLPFRNETGDARYDWVPAGVTSVLRSGFLQARALRLAGDDRVREILDVLKPAPGEETRPATAQRLGRLAGVDHVLAGSLVRFSDHLRLQASLIPIGEGATPRALVVDGQGDEALLGMMDQLTREVRDALGVSRSWGEDERLAAQLSTKSVDALSLYGEAIALVRAGKPMDAAERLRGATTRDPGFAVAWALLAETEEGLGRIDDAKTAAEQAVAHLAAVSPWEAARIRATRARLVGDLAVATRELEKIVAAAPNDPQSHLDLALVQEEAGDLAAARRSLERAVGLDPRHPGAQYALGRVLTRSGQSTEAAEAFNRALALYGDIGSEQGRATVLNGLGNVALELGQHEEAERRFQQALEIRRRIDDRRGIAVGLDNLALAARYRGQIDEAVRIEKDAIEAGKALGDPAVIATSFLNLGDMLQAAGRPDESLSAYQESLRILREVGDEDRLVQVLGSLGYLNSVLGKYVEAFFFMKEALAKARGIGDQTNLVVTLADIGGLEQIQGRYEEALKYFDEGLTLARQKDNKGAAVALIVNTAQVHLEQGNYDSALRLLADAETTARAARQDAYLASVLTALGNTRRRAGDLGGSATALSEALRIVREQSNDALLAEVLTYDGERLLAGGDSDRAGPILKEAVAVADRVGDFRLQRLAQLAQARATSSRRDLEAVLKAARDSGLRPLVAPALLYLARLDVQARHLDPAVRAAREAAESAARLHERDWLLQARHLLGSVLVRQGKTAEAAEAFRQALAPFEEMRAGLTGPPLAAFLARPETTTFAHDAEAAFEGSPPDRDRLAALLKP